MTPRISVLMPVFNAEAYLPQAIGSIIAQTFTDWELLICDDGSTDGSPGIAAAYQRSDHRIRLLAPGKQGLPGILNAGLQQAQAPFCARMDADDIALPRRLELQLTFLESHPATGALGGQAITIDAQGYELGSWHVSCHHDAIDQDHIEGWKVQMIHPTVMLRTELLLRLGGYSEQSPVEDIDLWLRLAEISQLANLPETILRYRVLNSSYSNSNPIARGEQFTAAAMEARQRRGLSIVSLPPPFWVDPTPRDPYDRAVEKGCRARAAGDRGLARRIGLSLLLKRPWSWRAWKLLLPRRPSAGWSA